MESIEQKKQTLISRIQQLQMEYSQCTRLRVATEMQETINSEASSKVNPLCKRIYTSDYN